MDQVTKFLAYVGPLLFIALKVGVVVGALGSALEAVGLYFKLPRVEAFGKALEAYGADIPKWIKNAWAVLPDFVKKLVPGFVPPAVLMLVAFHSTGCAWFKGSVEPIAKECAPSEASLVAQVSQLLLSGGDYAAQLEQLAVVDGAGVIECAVKAAIQALMSDVGKVGANSEDGAAVARGKAYLAAHPGGK